MYAFSAKPAGAFASAIATWLVRVVAYVLPTFMLFDQGKPALALAIALGLVDGLARIRVVRSAWSFVAETDALVVTSRLSTERIAWADVSAIEVWQAINRLDYVTIHYRGVAGLVAARCWEQDRRKELQAFVLRCAKLVQTSTPRTFITRASLVDRSVQVLLLRRLAVDLAIALLFGVVCGIVGKAIWLGAATGVVSTLIACSGYLHHAQLVSKDGAWSRVGKEGELIRLRIVPRSLRSWVGGLSQTHSD